MKSISNMRQPFQYTPTLNRMGYMSPSLDKIQAAFVDHCKPEGHYLDIGCGFGVATLPVVDKGCAVVACDLEGKHLDILEERVSLEKRSLLTLIKGHFPDEVTFPDNSFDGINLSMVLHFLPPFTIEKALKKIFLCLKEEGRLYITTSSPYQRTLSRFAPLYEERRFVEEWPGYISDIAEYVPQRAHFLPKENIVFCIHELRRLVSRFGFQVLESTFFSREEIPQDLSLDGREYSGVICEKPKGSAVVFFEKTRDTIPTQAANIR